MRQKQPNIPSVYGGTEKVAGESEVSVIWFGKVVEGRARQPDHPTTAIVGNCVGAASNLQGAIRRSRLGDI
jgi:hypothetical protein